MRRSPWTEHSSMKTIMRFCNMTSMHGYRFLGESNRSPIERFFWLVAIITANCFCGSLVYSTFLKWRSSDVVMLLDFEPTGNWGIPFPAITICSDNQLRPGLVYTKNEDMSSSEKQRLTIAKLICENEMSGEEEYISPSVFSQVAEDIVLPIEETVKTVVRLPYMNYSLMERFQTVIMWPGICFSFNLLPFEHLLNDNYVEVLKHVTNSEIKPPLNTTNIWNLDKGYPTSDSVEYPMKLSYNGRFVSFLIVLKYNEENYVENCNHGRRGFQFGIHNPADFPSSQLYDSMHLGKDQIADVHVHTYLSRVDRSLHYWSPEERGCFFHNEKKLLFFKVYTKWNCENECISLATLKHCGCVAFHQPRNASFPICGAKMHPCLVESFERVLKVKNDNNKMENDCNCLPSCTNIEYDFQYDSHLIQLKRTGETEQLLNEMLPNTSYSLIRLSYKYRENMWHKKVPMVGFIDFLAVIGGIFGLCLGCSFLSIFELIYFFSLRIITDTWNKTKVPRKGTVDSNEHAHTARIAW